MSAEAIRTRPTLRTEGAQENYTSTPHLRVIEGTTPKRHQLAVLIVTVIVVLGAIAASMVLHTQMAKTAYAIRELQIELNTLQAQAWNAQTELGALESAASLEEKAHKLGMVPATISGTISIADSSVNGGVASH